jgi:DNA polymerase-3 subunit epsilon
MSSTHYNSADRERIIQWAHELFSLPNFYILDTETTGLDKQDEIVQIGIIDKHGEVVLDSLVKATKPLSSEVTRIHGISNAMLRDAPTLDELYVTLSAKLAGTPLIAYNMDFDWRMISQSLKVYKIIPRHG